jgi:hypothetical protein
MYFLQLIPRLFLSAARQSSKRNITTSPRSLAVKGEVHPGYAKNRAKYAHYQVSGAILLFGHLSRRNDNHVRLSTVYV